MSQAIQNPALKQIMAQCVRSTKVTSKVLFPERFYNPFSSLHDEIFKLLDDDSKQRVAIAAPRGFGKTTINTITYPAKRILFQEKKFIVPVSATATHAVMQGENLKRELMTNVNIRKLFGPLKSDVFSKDCWITAGGTMVMPRGAGQQVRGILYGNQRPDLIIVDDLEDAESVMNPELRLKLKDWFFADLCNCVDRSSKDWRIIVIGTVLHEDALLVNLLDDPEWDSVRLEICDDDLKSNWPDFMPDSEVRKLYEGYKRRKQLDVFYREYRNIPISTENATFKADMFKYHDETKLVPSHLTNVVIVDPAKTVQLHSADSAVVCWGIDRTSKLMHFRDCTADTLYPDQLYDAIFDMVVQYNADILAIEVTSLNEFILQPLKNEMRKRGIFPHLVALNARGKKEERVAWLAPFYRQGYITHNKAISEKYEQQLLTFPRSRKWDVMDAAAYIVEVMEKEAIYFDPMDLPNDADEFEQLENPPAIDLSAYQII
jgi:hypothetical protein